MPSIYIPCEFFFFSLFSLCYYHAHQRKAIHELISAFIYGGTIEYIVYVGMEYHQPRMYDHSDQFIFRLPFGIPLYMITFWAIFLYVSNYTARTQFQVVSNSLIPQQIIIPLVAGGLAMSLDTTMEPIATRHSLWIYRIGVTLGSWNLGVEVWNGSPLINLASWMHLQIGFTAIQMLLPCKSVNNYGELAKQIACSIPLCIFCLWTLGPTRMLVSDANMVKVFFLISAIAALHGCTLTRAPRDNLIVLVVFLWHVVPILSLGSLSSLSQFSQETNVEFILLGICSVVLFAIGNPEGDNKKKR
jgi:uncharacterized membrane protein